MCLFLRFFLSSVCVICSNFYFSFVNIDGFVLYETKVYSAATTSVDGGGFVAANFSNFSGDVAISYDWNRNYERN